MRRQSDPGIKIFAVRAAEPEMEVPVQRKRPAAATIVTEAPSVSHQPMAHTSTANTLTSPSPNSPTSAGRDCDEWHEYDDDALAQADEQWRAVATIALFWGGLVAR